MRDLAFILSVGACALLAFSACGAEGDGGPVCSISLTVETATPVAGSSVVVRASTSESGFLEASWSLSFASNPVSCSDDADGLCEGTSIAFLPTAPGPYAVGVSGFVDSRPCNGDSTTINVMAPGANNGVYRMVVTPLAGGAVHEETVVIPGGADYDLGELRLGTALPVSGMVTASGSPIAAQLRVVSRQDSSSVDLFASPTLGFDGALEPGLVDIDILPSDPARAPARLEGLDPGALSTLALPVSASLGGSVFAPGGGGLDQARVMVTEARLPSGVASASGSGAFSLDFAAIGGTSEIAVSAPAASGLPALSGAIDTLGDGSQVVVSYDAGLVVSARSFSVTESNGTPIAGARVTFISDIIADGGTVSVDGGVARPLEGRVRRSFVADAGGLFTATLADAPYTVVVARTGASPQPPSRLRRTLGGGVETNLQMTPAAQWTASIQQEDTTPIENASISFRPRGDIALVAGASIVASTDALGQITTDVVADGSYDVQIDVDGRRIHHGQITAPVAGELLDAGVITIPAGQRVTGEITLASGATGRAHVAFYCTSCPVSDVPAAEAVTDAIGAYEVQLPDSGTQ